MYQSIIDLKPELKKIPNQDLKRKSDKFRYKSIIEYIFKSHKDFDEEFDSSFILNILPHYSVLSSFVHGGPWAEKEMRDHENEEWIKSEIYKDTVLAISITTGIKLFSFLTASKVNVKFLTVLKGLIDINKLISKMNRDHSEISDDH